MEAVAVTAPGAAEGTSADEAASDSSSGGVGGLGPLFDEGGDAGSAKGAATALASLNLQENDKASGAAVTQNRSACRAPACLGCQLQHRRVSQCASAMGTLPPSEWRRGLAARGGVTRWIWFFR